MAVMHRASLVISCVALVVAALAAAAEDVAVAGEGPRAARGAGEAEEWTDAELEDGPPPPPRHFAKMTLPAPPVFYIPSYGYRCNKRTMRCRRAAGEAPGRRVGARAAGTPSSSSVRPTLFRAIQLPAPKPIFFPKGNVRATRSPRRPPARPPARGRLTGSPPLPGSPDDDAERDNRRRRRCARTAATTAGRSTSAPSGRPSAWS